MAKNNSFTLQARLFHYVGLITIIALIVVGFFWKSLPESIRMWGISMHKLIGFVMLWVALAWVVSYVRGISPPPPVDLDAFKRIAARIVKALLLACAVVMPLSGWLMASAAGKPGIPALGIALPSPLTENKDLAGLLWQVHETTAILLIALIALHAGAAVYHHVIRKDFVLSRMFPFVSPPTR